MFADDPTVTSRVEAQDSHAGLYVHVPFCLTKCLYCDFYSVTDSSLCAKWLHALEQEAVLYKDRFPSFDTLYLGGGTPSLLSEEQIFLLVEGLFRYFSFSESAEFTLEANPEDVTPENLALYKRVGVNRISLGVQSLDDGELAYLGRRHDGQRAARAMEVIRESGFSHFGVDLIYGLPGQSKAAWKKTLERTLAFSPDHISCYQLTVNKGTPLWKIWERDGTLPLDEAAETGLFLMACEVLEEKGFIHYEVSNYARGSRHLCLHNLKYWGRVPCLGLGPSAHSFQGRTRWWNRSSVEAYCRGLERGARPIQGTECLSDEQESMEMLSLGLRTGKGIPLNDLNNFERTSKVLPGLLEQGFLDVVDGRAVPTRKGFLVADRLPLLFL